MNIKKIKYDEPKSVRGDKLTDSFKGKVLTCDGVYKSIPYEAMKARYIVIASDSPTKISLLMINNFVGEEHLAIHEINPYKGYYIIDEEYEVSFVNNDAANYGA